MEEVEALALHPIGSVIRGRPWPDRVNAKSATREQEAPDVPAWAEIEIDAGWAEALDGIEGFSHIWVVWWLNRSETPLASHNVRPEGRPEMPLVGLFATRSPRRPCPIAMTAVRLLAREGARLRVEGLDAYEGTPVFDIKPYLRRGDLISEATAPDWLERLWRIHDEERGVR
jgi:tRNA-Thr(GGU) m(6)t(6)A37 methyltransferase TsaA